MRGDHAAPTFLSLEARRSRLLTVPFGGLAVANQCRATHATFGVGLLPALPVFVVALYDVLCPPSLFAHAPGTGIMPLRIASNRIAFHRASTDGQDPAQVVVSHHGA